MMQAGKDYIAKGEPEYESPRAKYLRELLQTIKAQPELADVPAENAAEHEGQASRANQDKPTLKITK